MFCLSQLQIAYCNRKRCLFHNNSWRGALSQENESFFNNWSHRRGEWGEGKGWLKVDWAMYIRRIAAEIHPYCFNHSDTLSGRSIPLIFWWQILFYPPECVCKYSQMGATLEKGGNLKCSKLSVPFVSWYVSCFYRQIDCCLSGCILEANALDTSLTY